MRTSKAKHRSSGSGRRRGATKGAPRVCLLAIALATWAAGATAPAGAEAAALGSLAPLPGSAGCVAASPPSGAACRTGRALAEVRDLGLTTNGAHLYVGGDGGIAAFARNPGTGGIRQLAGTSGCVTATGAPSCGRARCMDLPPEGALNDLEVALDGNSVYAALSNGCLIILRRSQASGKLFQLPGIAGCKKTSTRPREEPCESVTWLASDVRTITTGASVNRAYVSAAEVAWPDDRLIARLIALMRSGGTLPSDPSVTGTGAVAPLEGADTCVGHEIYPLCTHGEGPFVPSIAARNPDSAVGPGTLYLATPGPGGAISVVAIGDSGGIRQRYSSGGCAAPPGIANCNEARELYGVTGLAVSPDNGNLYAVSENGALAVFRIHQQSGALQQLSGSAGCLKAVVGSSACARARMMSWPTAVAVSPDGRSVYVTSRRSSRGLGGIAVFRRDPDSGVLAQLPAEAGCVGPSDCTRAPALGGHPGRVAVSPDGAHIYVTDRARYGGALFALERRRR